MLDGRIVEGGFRPAGVHREWCDAEVLRSIRRKSLARLRKEVEPVEQHMLARLFTHWQGVLQPRRGLDALLDTIENLQGAPLPASLVESAILPSRLANYSPADLDTLIAAGEVVWCGFDALGERDGRISLYLADKLGELLPQKISADANAEPPSSPRGAVHSSSIAARRRDFSSRRSTMKLAVVIPERRWTRCGAWCGAAWSATIHFMRCEPTSRPGRQHAPRKATA